MELPRTAGAAAHQDRPDRQHGVVDIRQGDLGDGEAFCAFLDAELRRDYFIPRRQQAEILEGRYHMVWIAVGEGRILGVAIVSKAKGTLVNLLVAKGARRRGIGAALLAKASVQRVRAKLDVSAGDPRDFYRARGFESTGEFNEKGNIELLVAVRGSCGRHGCRPSVGMDAQATALAKAPGGLPGASAGEGTQPPLAKAPGTGVGAEGVPGERSRQMGRGLDPEQGGT